MKKQPKRYSILERINVSKFETKSIKKAKFNSLADKIDESINKIAELI